MPEFLKLNIQLPIEDPVLVFALVMLIILLAPMIIRRIRIPGLVGTILAGTIVGPSVLGLLERDQTIILLGTVGLLYLMFVVGLSIDLNKFESDKKKNIPFGFVSFLIPQLSAIPVGLYILDFSFESSLLLGSIVGSHTLLSYPIVNRIGITRNRAITMGMGGTIVTDMLSLTVLAIVANTVTGAAGLSFWITFSIMVLLYLGLVIVLLPIIARWFFRNVRDQSITEYVFIIAILFTTAFLAEQVGLAAIIGAFLAGLSLNRLIPDSSTLMSRVKFVGDAYFIPFFLISVGMLIDVAVMIESFDVWLQTALFTFLVLYGKTIAAKLMQLLNGFTSNEGWAMAGLTIPQAAATLAVTLVGFEIGLFTQTSVNAVVLMILITCILGPALVERYGRKVAFEESRRPYRQSEAPERILVPLANPHTAETLMDIAMIIRKDKSGDALFPLTVARDTEDVSARVAESEKLLSHAVVHAAAAEVPVSPATRVDMNISRGILRAVKELRISHIVIGWNGKITTRQKIFGSILDVILEETEQMLLVCKIDHPMNITKRVILMIPPYIDREPGFLDAMLIVKTLVSEIGSELLVIRTRNNQKITKEIIEKHKPELTAEFILLESWSDLLRDDSYTINTDDLVLLLSTRKGTISWDSNLERLPSTIARDYPNINFVTLYPSEFVPEEIPTDRIRFERSIIPSIKTENVHFELDDMETEKALEELLQKQFGDNKRELTRIIRTLMTTETENLPGELPGVVMTSTRSTLVDRSTLFLGISQKGIEFPGMDEKIHLVFVLVSPATHSLQRNLTILANLARVLGSEETVKQLMKASSMEDIEKAFGQKQKKNNSKM